MPRKTEMMKGVGTASGIQRGLKSMAEQPGMIAYSGGDTKINLVGNGDYSKRSRNRAAKVYNAKPPAAAAITTKNLK